MNRISIAAGTHRTRISRHIYGHFAEHLGRCIYDGIWCGEDAEIPNKRGIRTDVVDALRSLQIPNLRWPGGCFADDYHWRDGIGPPARRPRRINVHWGGVTETNRFGTHEFMDLCAQLGCEPYIAGNVGSGTVREMAQWIEYLTLAEGSDMAELRRANGRKRPWRVRFWGIGNENWACGGNMTANQYADLYRQFATYCRDFGRNRLYRIACGPGDIYASEEESLEWTRHVAASSGHLMQGISLHYYTVAGNWDNKGSAIDFDERGWYATLHKALQIRELLNAHCRVLDTVDPRRNIGLIVDEWGNWHDCELGTNPGFLYQQNTLRDALSAAVTLNVLNGFCNRVRMANLAQTVNVLQAVLLTDGAILVRTPTFHVFRMYRHHHDATHVPLEVRTEAVGTGDMPVPKLHASCSRAADGRLFFTLVNLQPSRPLALELDLGASGGEVVEAELLSGDKIHAHNSSADPYAVSPVAFTDFRMTRTAMQAELPARSILSVRLNCG